MAIVVKVKGDIKQLQQSYTQASTAGKSFFSTSGAAALGAAGGYTAAAGAVIGLGKAYAGMLTNFDEAKSSLARATGATGDALESVYDTFKETLKQVPDEMDQVAAVVGDAATRFADASEGALKRVSQTALDFARISGADATTVMQGLGQAANAMGVEAFKAAGALDGWTYVAQQSGISGNELATTIAKNATLLDTMGVSLDGAAVLLGQFHTIGIKSREVGTVLTTIAEKASSMGLTMDEALGMAQQAIQEADTEADAMRIASIGWVHLLVQNWLQHWQKVILL